jgi:hypothetical protein
MPAPLPPLHPETVIRDWGNGEHFSIADAVTGVAVFGATGSGKTSGTGHHLALGYLGSAAEMGGIVLCSTISEREQFCQWARETGRERDVVVFDASGKHRFNFLEWEASRASEGGGLTINVVALLEEIITALEPQKATGGGENIFWEDALHQLLTNAVELVQLAGYELSLTYICATSCAGLRFPASRPKAPSGKRRAPAGFLSKRRRPRPRPATTRSRPIMPSAAPTGWTILPT